MLSQLYHDHAVAVIRAAAVPDPVSLCRALVAGGIRCVEFTFTTPGVIGIIRTATAGDTAGAVIGAGTVNDAASAAAAIDNGARFLVTPGVNPAVAEVATDADIPLLLGAMTPTEVLAAARLGAEAVKIFPAGVLGAGYLTDLHGPFPNLRLVPSGGLHAGNAAAFTAAGAAAVTAGSSVVSAAAIADEDWAGITERAAAFCLAAKPS